jgi:2-hydroxychromene-2-carboxylate isomerase
VDAPARPCFVPANPPRPLDLPMPLSVDLFFSFRSPYSYLALPKTIKFVADYDATVNLRPVYPLAVRVPGFFKKANPQFARYVVLGQDRIDLLIWRMESRGLTRRSRC